MSELTLTFERTLNATPQEVFAAWTNSKELAKWFAPEGMTTEVRTLEAKEGGSYEVAMKDKDGKAYVVGGVFKEFVEPSRLVMSFKWISPEPGLDSEITVLFSEEGDGTKMNFTHTGFANEKQKEMHQQGWEGTFNKLERLFA